MGRYAPLLVRVSSVICDPATIFQSPAYHGVGTVEYICDQIGWGGSALTSCCITISFCEVTMGMTWQYIVDLLPYFVAGMLIGFIVEQVR